MDRTRASSHPGRWVLLLILSGAMIGSQLLTAGSALAATAPYAPIIGSASGGNASATVSWTPPASSGGSPITSYTVRALVGTTVTQTKSGIGCTTSSCNTTIFGLQNGTTYTFTVTAVNAIGESPQSTQSNAVTLAVTAPDQPTIGVASGGNASATVTWIPPTSGGSPITGYTIRAYVGSTVAKTFSIAAASNCWSTISGCTVAPLSNGTVYSFTVSATNSVGSGPESAQSNQVTPATTPEAPTNVQATPGDSKATVSWNIPNDNGSAIIDYTVTPYIGANPGTPVTGVICSANPCSKDVTGLTNSVTYTFTVYATNGKGGGKVSAHSPAIVVGIPSAPTDVKATAGNAQATVTWTASNGNGTAVSSYAITVYSGTTVFKTVAGLICSTTPCSAPVTGLTNGASYTFTVKATNGLGFGPESAHSPGVIIGTPDAPTSVVATPGNASAQVTWVAPSANGNVILRYTVITYSAATAAAVATLTNQSCSPSCSATVSGLANGTPYYFTVTAINNAGTGPESAHSAAVTPATVPDAPIIGTATLSGTVVTVTWFPPANDGGGGGLTYIVRLYTGTTVKLVASGVGCSTASCSYKVTGLDLGTSYTLRVSAVNAIGEGSQSAASNVVTPANPPDAPTTVQATAGGGSATVTWTPTPPTANGGAAITSYTVRAYVGNNKLAVAVVSVTCTTTICTAVVPGLTNGTSYTFTVAAVNSAGEGPESGPSNSVTPTLTVPDPPTIGIVTAGTASATVTWTPPVSNGGDPITSYTIRVYSSGLIFNTIPGAQCPTSPCSATVSGLTSGATYTFTVAAISAFGSSAESAQSGAITLTAVVPGAPTSLQAVAGNGTVTIYWFPPASNGGPAVTSYDVTITTGAVSTSQHVLNVVNPQATFNGLTNGAIYTVMVVANNSQGPSQAAVTSFTPQGSTTTSLSAPLNVTAVPGVQSALVTWSPPIGSPASITGYRITVYDGSTSTALNTLVVGANLGSATVSGLTKGKTYSFSVMATSAAGNGPESVRSNAVVLPDVPGAPSNVQATAGIGQATVTWSTPSTTGGSSITGYLITATGSSSADTVTMNVTGSVNSAIISPLASGKSYTFTVAAINALGTGAQSAASGALTLPAAPSTPRNLTVTPGDRTLHVSWQAPPDNGKIITGYLVTATSGSGTPITLMPTGTDVTLTGLVNGTIYTVSVVAINVIGQSGSVTTAAAPSTTPGAISGNAPPSLNLPGQQNVQYGSAITFDVSGTDPESADHLTLVATGLPDGLSLNDLGNGKATVAGTVHAAAGVYVATITIDDGHNSPVSQAIKVTVVSAAATLAPSHGNPLNVSVLSSTSTSGPITLKATVSGSGGDISNAVPVTCNLRSMNSGATFTRDATLKAGSAGTLAATCRFNEMPVDVYRVTYTVGGKFYQGSASGFLTVYQSTRGSVKGSGKLVHGGVSADFSLATTYFKRNSMLGSFTYTEHRTGGDVTLKSTRLSGIVFKAHKAYIEGTATLNGQGAYTFVVTVLDNSYRKTKTRVGVRMLNGPDTVSDLSFSPANLTSGKATVSRR